MVCHKLIILWHSNYIYKFDEHTLKLIMGKREESKMHGPDEAILV